MINSVYFIKLYLILFILFSVQRCSNIRSVTYSRFLHEVVVFAKSREKKQFQQSTNSCYTRTIWHLCLFEFHLCNLGSLCRILFYGRTELFYLPSGKTTWFKLGIFQYSDLGIIFRWVLLFNWLLLSKLSTFKCSVSLLTYQFWLALRNPVLFLEIHKGHVFSTSVLINHPWDLHATHRKKRTHWQSTVALHYLHVVSPFIAFSDFNPPFHQYIIHSSYLFILVHL